MAGKPTSEKAKHRADWAFLVSYHEARLADLLEHVRAGFVRYDAGEIDAFGLDDPKRLASETKNGIWSVRRRQH